MSISKKILCQIMVKTDKINKEIYDSKKIELFKNIKGKVVELGPGTGLNLDYLPKNIEYIGVEPNKGLATETLKRSKKLKIKKVKVINSYAEKINIKSNSVDFVITSLMLCSVKDLEKVLKEIKRILKKNGRFIFIEHVKGRGLRKFFQWLLTYSPYMIISDGCRPNIDIIAEMKKAGFKNIKYKTYIQKKGTSIINSIIMYPINPHVYGTANK